MLWRQAPGNAAGIAGHTLLSKHSCYRTTRGPASPMPLAMSLSVLIPTKVKGVPAGEAVLCSFHFLQGQRCEECRAGLTLALCPRWSWSEPKGAVAGGSPSLLLGACLTRKMPRAKGARSSVLDVRVPRVPVFTCHHS